MKHLKTILCLSLSIGAATAHADTTIPSAFRGVSFAIEAQENSGGLHDITPLSEQLSDGSPMTDEHHRQCSDIYMNVDRLREHEITANEIPTSIESAYVLKSVVSTKNQESTFVGRFKSSDETGSHRLHTITLKKTARGNEFELSVDKAPPQVYLQCTVDDYKAAVRRLSGIVNGQYVLKEDIPSTTEYAESQRLEAENLIEMYSEKRPFGITPHDVVHSVQ